MASEIRKTLDDIFHVACELPAAERAVFLDRACAGDEALRSEVEDLLNLYANDDTFLENPALHDAARQLARESAQSQTEDIAASDTRPDGDWMIGSYRIISQIGKGGMGVVYLADDPANSRQVAIKVLPRELVADQDRVARFQREGRMLEELRALKHSHIAKIYEQIEFEGNLCLVLEYVPGDTLGTRLRRGPVPLSQALRIAGQIADALATAHRRRIVHRDLKPDNIKITPEGQVKILDFGLAKRFEGDFGDPQASEFRTRSLSLTESGMLIGTPAYMSPEQWEGKNIDHRTDIWAFGCLLFEMLSGKNPFARRTRAETMKMALAASPDWQSLPAETPIVIQDLLRRCLQKDPDQRLADAREAQARINEAVGGKKWDPWLFIKSWIWKIDRRMAIALSAILILAAGTMVWKYTPIRSWLFPPELEIQITNKDDLTSVLQRRFQGTTGELLRAALSPQKYSSSELLTEQDQKSLRENQDYRIGIDEIIAAINKKMVDEGPSAQLYALLAQGYIFKYFLTQDEGDRNEAVKAANQAENLNADSVEVMIALGEVFNALGYAPDAIKVLSRANEKYPNNPDVLLGLAMANELDGDRNGQSETLYLQAISARETLNNGRGEWGDYNELASYYFSRGDYDLAARNWTKVTELAKLRSIGFSNLGIALMAQGCISEAINAFSDAIRRGGSAESYLNLAAAYIYAGRFNDAINTLKPMTNRTGNSESGMIETWGNLGEAYLLAGDRDSAIPAFEEALKLVDKHLTQHPDDSGVIAQKAEYIAKLDRLGSPGKRENPVPMIEKTVQPGSDCLECLVTGAVVFNLLDDKDRAVSLARRAADEGYSKFFIINHPELADLRNQKAIKEIAAGFIVNCK